jgi:hypothetical protein
MVRRLIPTVAAVLLAAAPCAFAQVETVALFNPSLLETPESIAIDHDNNKYVSLALTGEIRKIAADGSQSTFAMLPLGAPPLTFCGSFFAGLTGLTFDEHDNLYGNVASCDPGSRGIFAGPASSTPRLFVQAANQVFFSAGDLAHGIELWAVPLAALDVSLEEQLDELIALLGIAMATAVRLRVPTWNLRASRAGNYLAGAARAFSSSNQLRTTVSCAEVDGRSGFSIRKRLPSRLTS